MKKPTKIFSASFLIIISYFFLSESVFGVIIPAFVQGKSADAYNKSSISITFDSSVASGDVIVFDVFNAGAVALSNVTASCVNGNLIVADSIAGLSYAAIGYGVINSSGSCTVTATLVSTSGGNFVMAVHEISGVDTTNPLDGHTIQAQTAPGTGTDAVSSGGINTTLNGDYIFGVCNNNNSSPVVGIGYTGRVSNIYALSTEDQVQTSKGVIAATCTSNRGGYDSFITGIIAFRPNISSGAGDIIAPSTPTNLSATAISSSAINLSWTSSTDNVAVIGYKIFRGGVQIGTSATSSYSDSGLSASTLYSYTVSAQDGSGNSSTQSSSVSATTQSPPAPDTTPPSTPTNLSAVAISISAINLLWTASNDNVEVTGYKIFRGGVQVGTSATNSYSDSGLTASTNYSYTVSSYDAAGNNSSQSNSVNATTQAPPVQGTYPWSGILNPSRAVDWSMAGVSGGIPTNRTQCGSTISAGASISTINSAINSCGANQYVQLGAGTFNLTSGILFNSKNNVTIRGMGANQTLLVFTGSNSCQGLYADICVQSSDTNWKGGLSNSANWTSGYTKGANIITLSSVTNLKVGNPIILDQADDTCDNGGVIVSDSTGSCTPVSPGLSGPYSLQGNGGGFGRPGRFQEQFVTVISCDGNSTLGHACSSGNNITISPGLYMSNWSSSKSPQAWWATNPILGVGIEDLSMDNSASLNSFGSGVAIGFFNAQNSWVKGVRSIASSLAHVDLVYANHITVRDSYFFLAKFSTSQSYGFNCESGSDNLVENNIFQAVSGPLTMNGACSGTVMAYNYDVNNFYTASPGYINAMSNVHAAGTDNILYEGNIGPQVYSDVFHGTRNLVTYFRNYFRGNQDACDTSSSSTAYASASFGACTTNKLPVILLSFGRFFNFVGNVLGQTGIQNGYETGTPIFDIGDGNGLANDPNVRTTLLRWGNYDTVNNAVRWNASEVPSNLTGVQSIYLNSVPSTQSLPASFYLSSKPSWFGSVQWPPIGPDVNGGNVSGVASHVNTIPAQNCFSNIMGGPSNGTGPVLSFNASTCYGTSNPPPLDTTPPSIPTNLSATAISSSQINLSWTASSDNVAVTGYKIYRGGVQIGTSATNSYSDSGLTANTLYSYTVSAYDAAGNTSSQSTSASATTQSGTPVSTKFTTGQRVQTTSNLNVRATASASGTLLGTQPHNALGTILSGGISADGFFWWNVNYDSGADGWSIEDYLQTYSAPIVGDFNGDGMVNSIDLSLMTSAWNTSNATYDLYRDGIVNSLDYAIMVQNWSL